MQSSWNPAIAAAILAGALLAGTPRISRAVEAPPPRTGLLLRLAAGPAYMREAWDPSGQHTGATHAGWGPSLEITVGAHLRPGLVIAGTLQITSIINRKESYLGRSVLLSETLHFVDALGVMVDAYPNPRRGFHFGGSVGPVAVSEVDTYMFAMQTSWGLGMSLHVGCEIALSRRWAAGLLARVLAYRTGSESPPPSATSTGLLPTLLLAFTFD